MLARKPTMAVMRSHEEIPSTQRGLVGIRNHAEPEDLGAATTTVIHDELEGVLRIARSSVRAVRVSSFGQYFGHVASRGLSSSSCTQSTLSLHIEQQR